MENEKSRNTALYMCDENVITVERFFTGQTDLNSIVKSIIIEKSNGRSAAE